MAKFRNLFGAVAFGAMLGFAGVASAATIDTTGPVAGAWQPFGSMDTATYGQTFTAGGGFDTLNSFSMFLNNRTSGSGPLDLRGYVASWNGSRATGILFESDTRTMTDGSGPTEFAFNVGSLALNSGQQYVLFLSISNLPVQPENLFDMPQAPTDLVGGEFVFYNNGTNFAALTGTDWEFGSSGNGTDVQFIANFNAQTVEVPEPATLALLGAGLLGLGMARRRRR